MVSKANFGLKALQFFFRFVIFLCAIVVLGIYSYFLASLRRHDITIHTWVRAVEGLAGSAALYSLIGVVLLWCLAGHTVASAFALFLDVCFIGCFIYIAAANRGGAGSCNGDAIRTPFGTSAAATTTVTNSRGKVVHVLRFRSACKLETAVLAVSVIAALLLVFAFFTEILLARNHRKEKKFGPGPNNGYTSGSGGYKRRLGPFGFKRRQGQGSAADVADDPNALPLHAEPDYARQSYNTEATVVGSGGAGATAGGHDAAKLEPQGRNYGNFEPVRYDLPQQLHPGANTKQTNF